MSNLGLYLAKKLKEFRKRLGKTQEEMAKTLDLTRATINRWEKNGAGSATLDQVEKISLALGIHSLDLIKPEDMSISHPHSFQDCFAVVSQAAAKGSGNNLVAKMILEPPNPLVAVKSIPLKKELEQEQSIPADIIDLISQLSDLQRKNFFERTRSMLSQAVNNRSERETS